MLLVRKLRQTYEFDAQVTTMSHISPSRTCDGDEENKNIYVCYTVVQMYRLL